MSETVTSLNTLIETLKDGEAGYTTAAKDATRTDLKALFSQYAAQRAQFAAKLQTLVQQSGEAAETSGSLAGGLHRGWIDLKAAVSSREDLAILEECERCEDSALKVFGEAISGEHLGTARPEVQQQLTGIRAAHDRVKMLRDQLRSAEKVIA